jgi:hypothetical protein
MKIVKRVLLKGVLTMAKSTRRTFLKKASVGAGIFATTVAAGANLEFTSSASAQTTKQDLNNAASGLVIYGINQKKGTFVVLSGESATTFHNPALVEHLSSL